MNVFEFESYQDYFGQLFKVTRPKIKKSDLAAYLNCQPAFISQVLGKGKTHFSHDHLYQSGKFFQLNDEQINYLLLLLSRDKASHFELKRYYEKRATEYKERRNSIKRQLSKKTQSLTVEDQATYYSHWAYMTFHMAASLEKFHNEKSFFKHFKLDQSFIRNVLHFLISKGLIQDEGHLNIGKTRIHLEKKSPFLKMLHQNLRQKAIKELTKTDEFSLHYSSVLTLSKKDSLKIRQMVLDFIKSKEKILAPSNNEELVILNIDYFKP